MFVFAAEVVGSVGGTATSVGATILENVKDYEEYQKAEKLLVEILTINEVNNILQTWTKDLYEFAGEQDLHERL